MPLLVNAIKFLFLFCMINYSLKTLIDYGFKASKKIVLNIYKKLSECLFVIARTRVLGTRTLALGTRTRALGIRTRL